MFIWIWTNKEVVKYLRRQPSRLDRLVDSDDKRRLKTWRVLVSQAEVDDAGYKWVAKMILSERADRRKLKNPMPPWFELTEPRKFHRGGYCQDSDGNWSHSTGWRYLSPSEEAWYRYYRPSDGLCAADRSRYEVESRGLFTRLHQRCSVFFRRR